MSHSSPGEARSSIRHSITSLLAGEYTIHSFVRWHPMRFALMEWLYYVNIMLLIYRGASFVLYFSWRRCCFADSLSVASCHFCDLHAPVCVSSSARHASSHYSVYHFLPSNLNSECTQPQSVYTLRARAPSIWVCVCFDFRTFAGGIFSLSSFAFTQTMKIAKIHWTSSCWNADLWT